MKKLLIIGIVGLISILSCSTTNNTDKQDETTNYKRIVNLPDTYVYSFYYKNVEYLVVSNGYKGGVCIIPVLEQQSK
jgi:hypothetical protein